MSHSLVNIREVVGEVISENIISDSRRAETVELKGSPRIKCFLDVKDGKSGEGTSK
jgi:hypothetical protein